jgi:hypothetical protein
LVVDFGALLMPGVKELATSMMSDAWSATRDAIARRWGRGDKAETEKAVVELDHSRSQALSLFSGEEVDERIMQAFVAGFLASTTYQRPERADAMLALAEGRLPVQEVTRGGNHNSGRVDKLAQIDGDVHGGVHL